MSLSLKAVFTAAALTFTTAMPALLPTLAVAQDSTRTSVDWAGTYSGTVPCASCPGIRTKLVLRANDRFELTETYIDKSKPMITKGKLKWNKDGSSAKLVARDENREIFISEGYVEFIGDDRTQDNPQYRLKKAGNARSDTGTSEQKGVLFRNNKEVLSTTMATVGHNGDKVQFNGLWDFGKVMPAGHRSLESIIVIDCKAKTYGLTNVLYYSGAKGKGKILDQTEQKDPDMNPIPPGRDVIAQAKQSFCKS